MCIHAVVLFSLILLCIQRLTPIALVIGFLNYDVCKYSQIPLYLIVAGILLLLEVVIQSSLCACRNWLGDDKTYRKIRRCDFVMVLLFIWLLIGTNWMFRLGIGNECSDGLEGDVQTVDDTVEPGGTTTQTTELIATMEGGSGTGGEDCSDCSQDVYVFAAVLILIQYIFGLFLVAMCCSNFFKGSSSN